MLIAGNIAKIEERIQSACRRAGRDRHEITLMGVTKFVPVDLIEEAFNAGIRYFGESRVKEAAQKFTDFKNSRPEARLHMIGSLQRNKAKQACYLFDCIQSADRHELIGELAKQASLRASPLDILLELHTGEETKSGFENINELLKAAQTVLEAGNLRPAGLMTMAPFTADANLIRASFRLLVNAQKELLKHFPLKEGEGNWNCLSMGMSNDFEIAVEEGSTLLRIGSAIFKE
ncbi:MAG: YggS family pyridoxal phosphate-dependent enzyme [Treponema sp.]|nr:YggS family pyridoxal phosphate-dependent enzyme [Treponema sp.]